MVLSPTSENPDHRWLIPQTPIGEDIASSLKERLPSLVESLHRALYVRNRGSGFVEKNFSLSSIECPNIWALALLIQNLNHQ